MKKIVFMIISMNIGGTEKALLNMVSEMSKDKFDITILMLEKYGEFLESIPEGIHIEYLNGYENIKDIINKSPQRVAFKLAKKGKFIMAFNIMFMYMISKILGDRTPVLNYIIRGFPVFDKNYDIAVAYAGPMEFITYYVLKNINAKIKIQWIHFDITKIGFNKKFMIKMYRKFDKIFVVSEEARNKLISLIPTLKEKTEVFFNIVSSKMIYEQVKKGSGFTDSDFDGIRILTVGRLSVEKGQDIAINVLAKLINDGYKVKWYCIGEGNYRREYEDLIEKYNLKDKFILLGLDTNPYTYMNQCDIYVQPSRYEGYCIAIIEAKCLNRPIVATNVNGVNEQIIDGKTGLVVSVDENEIYESIKKLINDNELANKFSNNLSNERFDPILEMNKIHNLI